MQLGEGHHVYWRDFPKAVRMEVVFRLMETAPTIRDSELGLAYLVAQHELSTDHPGRTYRTPDEVQEYFDRHHRHCPSCGHYRWAQVAKIHDDNRRMSDVLKLLEPYVKEKYGVSEEAVSAFEAIGNLVHTPLERMLEGNDDQAPSR